MQLQSEIARKKEQEINVFKEQLNQKEMLMESQVELKFKQQWQKKIEEAHGSHRQLQEGLANVSTGLTTIIQKEKNHQDQLLKFEEQKRQVNEEKMVLRAQQQVFENQKRSLLQKA